MFLTSGHTVTTTVDGGSNEEEQRWSGWGLWDVRVESRRASCWPAMSLDSEAVSGAGGPGTTVKGGRTGSIGPWGQQENEAQQGPQSGALVYTHGFTCHR